MKFEIGKTYIFRNLRTEESNDFQKGDDYVYETLVWTGGTWTITIENEEALETMMDAQIKDDPPTFEFEEGAYVGDSYDWSLDDCDSDGWTINLSENLLTFFTRPISFSIFFNLRYVSSKSTLTSQRIT